MPFAFPGLSDAGASEEPPGTMRLVLGLAFLAIPIVLIIGTWMYHRQARRASNRVVCFGNSLTACGGYGGRYTDYLAIALPKCDVVNRGVGGETLSGGRNRFRKDVLDLQPRVVVIELGANDFHQAIRSIDAMRADLEYMIAALRERKIGVVIAGVFGPQLDEEGNEVPKIYKEGSKDLGKQILEMERDLARKYDCIHIENIQANLNHEKYWEDERHPNAEGNRLVAEIILPAIKKLLPTEALED